MDCLNHFPFAGGSLVKQPIESADTSSIPHSLKGDPVMRRAGWFGSAARRAAACRCSLPECCSAQTHTLHRLT